MSGMFFKNSSQPAKGEAYTYIPLLADESNRDFPSRTMCYKDFPDLSLMA